MGETGMKEISEKIAIARKNKNLSQTALARQVSITPQMVSKWERGESLPDVVMLGKLAEILGVNVTYFFGDETAKQEIKTTKPKNRAKLNDHKWKGNDFSNTNMTDLDFALARFVDCNFSGCNISGKKLGYTEFIDCNLDNADFTASELKNADFKNCSFCGSTFTNATLNNTDFKNSAFKNCDLKNTIFESCQFKNTTFENCTADKITYNFLLTCKVDIKGFKVNG